MSRPHTAYIGNVSPGFEWTVEPHWDDLIGTESQGSAGAALTYAAFRDTPLKLFSFRNSQNDELHLRFQLLHAWDPETSVKFHVHTVPLTDPSGAEVVRFEGQYVWSLAGDEIPANSGWTAFTKDFELSPGDVNVQRVVGLFTATPPADAHESAILLIYVKRAGSDSADTYGGNLAILSLDVHFQRVKIGTLLEHPEVG